MGKIRNKLLLIAFLLILFLAIVQPVLADNAVEVHYYHSSSCGTCTPLTNAINEIIREYFEEFKEYSDEELKEIWIYWSDNLVIYKKDTGVSENWTELQDIDLFPYPCAVITNGTNTTKIPRPSNDKNKTIVFKSNVKAAIDAYITGDEPIIIDDDTSPILPFFGKVNISSLSMPALTVILGVVDSLNPCAMFILFILLSLLIHAQSRRRMLLVGGIFIFFSGLWYFIFMFVLQKVFSLTETIILSLVVGIISLAFGIINAKDFFFFKKGASLSIPESTKPGIYKKIRNLVKIENILILIISTILFAVTVNLFELICSLQWPVIYLSVLETYNYPNIQNYLYILAYNIIYVIPLAVILLIFTFTLGQRKITEWQGQVMKLFSGIMLFCFSAVFLTQYVSKDPTIVENLWVSILILTISIILTAIISFFYKNKGKTHINDIK